MERILSIIDQAITGHEKYFSSMMIGLDLGIMNETATSIGEEFNKVIGIK